MKIRFEIENEIPALRFAEVYCPECNSKFDAMKNGRTDSYNSRPSDYIDLQYAIYKCPQCNNEFRTRGQEVEFI